MKQWLIAILISLIAVAGALVLYLSLSQQNNDQRQPRARFVHVAEPVMQPMRDIITAVGTLQAREDVVVTSEVSGRVVKLNASSGGKVKKGDLLVQLDARQVQANLNVMKAQLTDAERQLNRATRLRQSNSISQSQVDMLETAVNVARAELQSVQVRLDNHRIEAPFDGQVGLLEVSVGAYLENGDQITTLDATDVMELAFAVPERFLGKVHINQPVTGRSPAYPEDDFNGTLAELGVRVDPLSRTLPVRALITNEDGRLRPGMYMSVSLVLEQRESLVIPEQAVLTQGSDQYVFVARGDTAERLPVKLGVRDGGYVEVLDGIKTDDPVIITAQDRLTSGDLIKILEEGDPIPDSSGSGSDSSDQQPTATQSTEG